MIKKCCGYMLFKKLLERFTKKNCKKQIKKHLGRKKQLKEKAISYMSNGEATILLLTAGLIKKI